MRLLAFALVAACSAPASAPVRTASPAPAPAARMERDTDRDASADAMPASAPDPSAQTALKTRAHPFAIYVARMHRKLHETWANGFLASLANKPVTDPLNDPQLSVQLEIAIEADGSALVDVIKPSHVTAFDRAAVDAFETAAPFEPTPDSIRSADGRVHMRWALHRDERECGTFGVEPLFSGKPDP
jgi:hypothetical protein